MSNPIAPPELTQLNGRARRVGVEVEFANVDVSDASGLVQNLFGGEVLRESAHRIRVRNSALGDFTVELDAQIVHQEDAAGTATSDFEVLVRETLGYAVAGLVPVEIVCPPIAWDDLGKLRVLFDALREYGAEGSDAALLYGFGLHLNPEVAQESAEYVLRHLRAYVILEDWLREAIQVDPTRRLLPYIDHFPEAYMKRILDPGYDPDLPSLNRDYVRWNPTRNRGLDMLPLFRFMDEDTLVTAIGDASLVKPRPTFHYRLPNASPVKKPF